MSSTFVTFTPSTTSVFSFQASIGGTIYAVTVTWNIFGQRFYINVSDLSGNLILSRAIVSSGDTFQSAFTWANGWALAVCASNHNIPVGRVANINVSQTGTAYDGDWQVLATTTTNLTWQLANPNESNVVNGNVNFAWNLVSGYVPGYLLYHYATQQFEYGP